jgi:hypothetical protein
MPLNEPKLKPRPRVADRGATLGNKPTPPEKPQRGGPNDSNVNVRSTSTPSGFLVFDGTEYPGFRDRSLPLKIAPPRADLGPCPWHFLALVLVTTFSTPNRIQSQRDASKQAQGEATDRTADRGATLGNKSTTVRQNPNGVALILQMRNGDQAMSLPPPEGVSDIQLTEIPGFRDLSLPLPIAPPRADLGPYPWH